MSTWEGCTRPNRLFLTDQSFLDHVHGNSHLGLGGAFSVPSLEKPQLALFNGEFHVLHVAVVILQLLGNGLKLGVSVRHLPF